MASRFWVEEVMGCSLWYEAKIRRNGDESKGLGHLLDCPSEVCQELVHFGSVDGGVVPCHTVASGEALAVAHAPLEGGPGRVGGFAEFNARLSGVVEEALILNPEGGVPGLIVCPTVEGGVGSEVVDGVAHVVCG